MDDINKKIKIGLIVTAYQCKNLDFLDNWIKAKKSGIADIRIAVTTALFKEYADLGAKYDNEQTELLLTSAKEDSNIDYLNVIKHPILDWQNREISLQSLKAENVDFIWQLDSDEYYSLEEIKNAIEWLKSNDLYDFYRVNFRNYIGKPEDRTYVLDFKPVRIINNRNHNGISKFYFDNDVEFNNKTRTPFCAGTAIPIRVCQPKHFSWVGSKEFLNRKIEYQKKAIGTCSYAWDVENDCLIFNKEYYNQRGIDAPAVYSEKHLDR